MSIAAIPRQQDAFVMVTIEVDGLVSRAYLPRQSVPCHSPQHFSEVIQHLAKSVAIETAIEYFKKR
jgi:hypothetical protein